MRPLPFNWKKKEIGDFHEMGMSAVNQASRRLEQAIREEHALKKLKDQIAQRLNMCNVEPDLVIELSGPLGHRAIVSLGC